MTEKIENKIVKNDSTGFGYKYASLADIANQGFAIPKMKTGTDAVSLKDYVFYFDSDINDWVRGAEIVIPENIVNKEGKNKMNSAQLYGSSLTYARRYTVQMALGLACDDDSNLESVEENKIDKANDKASEKQVKMLRDLYSQEEIAKIIEHYNIASLEELSKGVASKYISNKMSNKMESKNDNNKQS